MDLLMRVRKPMMNFLLLFLEVVAAIFLSQLMYPVLAYVLSGKWTSVAELTGMAIERREWGAFLALQIPMLIAVCGLATVIRGAVLFVKEFCIALSVDGCFPGTGRMP